jgi:hypothetical protein
MKHRSIYETNVSKTTLNTNQINDLVKYLITYRNEIIIDQGQQKQILSQKSGLKTPISEIFAHLIREGIEDILKLIVIPKSIIDTPEVLTYPHLTFDIYQLYPVAENAARSLGVTDFNKKIITNVTPWYSTRTEQVTSLSSLQSSVVRDLFSRSYFTSDRTWISPRVVRSTGKVYTMSLATTVAGKYQLTAPQMKIISIPIAYYYFSQILDPSEIEPFLMGSSGALKLDRSTDVQGILAVINEHIKDPARMTLDDLCLVLRNIGIQKLQINPMILNTITKSWGKDIYTSKMSLEYPPYWVYNLLLAGSGEKTGLYHLLKRMGADREIDEIVKNILSSPSLV